MLEKFLGLETLRSGLNDYLNTHKYGNADTTDLWSVLSLHAKNTVQVRVSESYYYAATRQSPDLISFSVHNGYLDLSDGFPGNQDKQRKQFVFEQRGLVHGNAKSIPFNLRNRQ